MYLIDTNVWLERLLDQQSSEEAGRFLDRTPPEHLYLTDFSLHSIGLILTRLNKNQPFAPDILYKNNQLCSLEI